MTSRRDSEDILNPQRGFYRLLQDYTQGKLDQKRVFYRAIVIRSAIHEGELEANPPCPIGSVRARIYTHAMDSNTPDGALSIFYPLFPGDVPQPGEHVYVMFEDENMSSGLWISKVPNYTDINFANPDEHPSAPQGDSGNKFEGTSPAPRIPSTTQYRSLPVGSQQQDNTVRAFEAQENSIWTNKRVLIAGDSQMHGWPGKLIEREIKNRGASYVKREGRTSWGVSAWLSGRFGGTSDFAPPNGPTLPELISQFNIDIVVLGLGGNDWHVSNLTAYRNNVQTLWNQAKQTSDQFWVGPPDAFPNFQSTQLQRFKNGRTAVENVISEVVGEKFIKVSDATASREGRDRAGLHFANSASVPREYIRRVVDR